MRGWGQTLQTYFQSGAFVSMMASACMTSCAPLLAASPPTVSIMIWSGETPSASRTVATFGSSIGRGMKASVSQPTGSTSMLAGSRPSRT